MRFVCNCIAATALLAATTAHAGGLAEEIMEAPVVVEEEMAPAGSSISPAIIVVGILAALLLAANLGDDEETTVSLSDQRLKEDVVKVGTAFNGLPIYSFSYTGQDGTYLGVMAQDVLMHTPEAVSVTDNGYMAVNYGMLGMRMVQIN